MASCSYALMLSYPRCHYALALSCSHGLMPACSQSPPVTYVQRDAPSLSRFPFLDSTGFENRAPAEAKRSFLKIKVLLSRGRLQEPSERLQELSKRLQESRKDASRTPKSCFHTLIFSYYHSLILSYDHILALSYSHTLILAYSCLLILSFSRTHMLSYPHTLVLSCSPGLATSCV